MPAMSAPFEPAPFPPPAREPVFNIDPTVAAALAVLALLHAAVTLLPAAAGIILPLLAFIPARGWGDPLTWTGLVTHSLLHGDFVHLAVNGVWLAVFGSPLAARLGAGRFILFWMATAAAGALTFVAMTPSEAVVLVGASGAISGMTGAAARFSFRVDRSVRPAVFLGRLPPIGDAARSPTAVSFVAMWLALNWVSGAGLLTGGDAGIAWQAHLGGFLAGFFGIGLFDRKH